MKDPKISREMAEQEFERFCESMDLDIDTSTMDEDDRKGHDQQKDRIVGSIMKGSLVINDNGEPVFTPTKNNSENKQIIFHEPTGASLMAMDRKKKNEDVSKLFGTMADMSGTDIKTFSKMDYRDLKVCLAVTTLFLA